MGIFYQHKTSKYGESAAVIEVCRSFWSGHPRRCRRCLVNRLYAVEKRDGAGHDRAIPSNFDLFLNLAIVQMHLATDARRRDD